MNYEQKYQKTLERAKTLYENANCMILKKWVERVFPELKESDDERIKESLLEYLHTLPNHYTHSGVCTPEWIAWLEKQGEFYTKRDVDNAYIEGMAFAKDELEKQGKQKGYTFKSIPRLLDMIEPSDKAKAYCQKLIDTLVKEGYNTDAKIVEEILKGWNGEDVPMAVMDEQKPVFEIKTPEESLGIDSATYNKIVDECIYGDGEQNPADKLKPKFKVGDWIVQKGLGTYKIVEVCESWYEVISYNDGIQYSIGFNKENDCHLWTIQDAKDGDVIYLPNGNNEYYLFIFKGIENAAVMSFAHFYQYNDGTSVVEGTIDNLYSVNDVFQPATKQQRDLLFQKMKESGYEWDADKKELNKKY